MGLDYRRRARCRRARWLPEPLKASQLLGCGSTFYVIFIAAYVYGCLWPALRAVLCVALCAALCVTFYALCALSLLPGVHYKSQRMQVHARHDIVVLIFMYL